MSDKLLSAEEIVKRINNAEWNGNGDPLYSFDQVLTAMETYKSQSGGMKWVKASERLPKVPAEYCIKMRHKNDEPGDPLTNDWADFDPAYGGTWQFMDQDWTVVEWLDESTGEIEGWIPVEKGLPEKDRELWLAWEDGGVSDGKHNGDQFIDKNGWSWVEDPQFWQYSNKPAPPKPVEVNT
jgi:hypothetical protein